MEATIAWISAMVLVCAAVTVEKTSAELEYCTGRLAGNI